MKKVKKLLLLMMVIGLTVGVLAGCANPKDTAEEFLTAIQKGDLEKARTFVESDKEFSKLNEKTDDADGKAMLSAITKSFKFEKLEEVSKKDDKAEVKVKVTSVDLSIAVTKAMGEVMPMAFASAFSEDKEQSEKAIEKTMTSTIIKNLSDKEAAMATREVTLNLKKDKDGDYKIVADDNLQELLFANAKSLEKMFGGK
ncbi:MULTISPECIES: hypothetical protein [Bacillus cereus group]|uniref:hypothetical protein n=1 Tax=Bacillus cereus group TaxID=86661 RepID=UPI0008640D2B|nr:MULTISPECIES: hypothetical protein [Bacillus cereus group]MBJ8069685.1 hypothetical protein [Bacillus cereus]MBJ8187581.1 hypothetical protein [Bacillus cereus]OFD45702.1 hypothetical protein BWGOE2_12520 [Bacillus mycoides]OFD49104.1 hypothetical protein BWGOE1_12740 [Bacillus mycoides]OFD51238.1 hypothetical protein BWGOE3_13210 [Bacillus mycoides]